MQIKKKFILEMDQFWIFEDDTDINAKGFEKKNVYLFFKINTPVWSFIIVKHITKNIYISWV